MAISDQNKIDRAFKFVSGKSFTTAQKGADNEDAVSGTILGTSSILLQDGEIPAVALLPSDGGFPSTVLSFYGDGVSYARYKLTYDISSPLNTAFYASTDGSSLSQMRATRQGNWVPPAFGNYTVRIFLTSGVSTTAAYIQEIFFSDATSPFFDYKSGILTFESSPIAAYPGTDGVQIGGYRYIGPLLSEVFDDDGYVASISPATTTAVGAVKLNITPGSLTAPVVPVINADGNIIVVSTSVVGSVGAVNGIGVDSGSASSSSIGLAGYGGDNSSSGSGGIGGYFEGGSAVSSNGGGAIYALGGYGPNSDGGNGIELQGGAGGLDGGYGVYSIGGTGSALTGGVGVYGKGGPGATTAGIGLYGEGAQSGDNGGIGSYAIGGASTIAIAGPGGSFHGGQSPSGTAGVGVISIGGAAISSSTNAAGIGLSVEGGAGAGTTDGALAAQFVGGAAGSAAGGVAGGGGITVVGAAGVGSGSGAIGGIAGQFTSGASVGTAVGSVGINVIGGAANSGNAGAGGNFVGGNSTSGLGGTGVKATAGDGTTSYAMHAIATLGNVNVGVRAEASTLGSAVDAIGTLGANAVTAQIDNTGAPALVLVSTVPGSKTGLMAGTTGTTGNYNYGLSRIGFPSGRSSHFKEEWFGSAVTTNGLWTSTGSGTGSSSATVSGPDSSSTSYWGNTVALLADPDAGGGTIRRTYIHTTKLCIPGLGTTSSMTLRAEFDVSVDTVDAGSEFWIGLTDEPGTPISATADTVAFYYKGANLGGASTGTQWYRYSHRGTGDVSEVNTNGGSNATISTASVPSQKLAIEFLGSASGWGLSAISALAFYVNDVQVSYQAISVPIDGPLYVFAMVGGENNSNRTLRTGPITVSWNRVSSVTG